MSLIEKYLKAPYIARELRKLKEKAMGHKARTWMEGLLVGVVIAVLGYVADNATLLFGGDRSVLYAGIMGAALAAAKGYVAARYATPPDIKEKIETGEFPERRDLSTRQLRQDGTQDSEVLAPDPIGGKR